VKTRTSSTGSKSRSSRRGFTLMELLLVMFMITLFFSVLFLRLESPLSGGDLRLAGRMVVNEISRARAEAATNHADRFLRFNLEKNWICLMEGKSASREGIQEWDDPLLRVRELPRGVFLEDLVLKARLKVQEGEADIRFSANGASDRALIHIRNEENEVLTLTLHPLTGEVEVQEGYVDERES